MNVNHQKNSFSSNIILLGLPGSGKSSVGLKLAKILNLGFCDLDSWIELGLQKKISEIFLKEGEAYFRNIENKVLRNFLESKNQVIAVGGGVVEAPGNIDVLKDLGVCIWLDISPHVISRRLLKNKVNLDKRPIFHKDKNKSTSLDNIESIEDKLKQLLDKRAKYYNYSHIKLKEDYADSNTLANILKVLLIEYKNKNFKN